MRITFVMMQFPLPTQTFAMSDIAALTELGHQVDVESLLPPTKRQRELIASYGLDGRRINNVRFWRYLLGVVLTPIYCVQNFALFKALVGELVYRPRRLGALAVLLPRVVELVSKLSKDRPDVVHAFWGHWPSLVPAMLALRSHEPITSVHMGAYDLYAGFPLRLTADTVRHRFTHSESNMARIQAMGVGRDVHMIHRGIPLDELSNRDPSGDRIQKTPMQFCTASALVKEKRVDVVLRIFAQLRSALPSASLVVIGDGDERGALEALTVELGIEDAVSFVGYTKRQTLFKIMCASEFFLFFSGKVSERLPNVVKEAMLAQCVCVVSRTQGIDELIEGPDCGVIIDHVSPEKVVPEVLQLAEDSGRRRVIGSNASLLVQKNFSSDSSMKRYQDIWRG